MKRMIALRGPVARTASARLPHAGALALALVLGAQACSGSSGAGAGAAPPAPPGAPADEAWRSELPRPGAPRGVVYPPAQVSRLPNGVALYLVPRPTGTVALSVAIRSGGAANLPRESGLAALSLRLMTEATQKKNALELALAAESLGSSLAFDTGRDGSSVSLEVLPLDADAGLALLAEVIREPRFAAEDVERVKRQWLDSLVSERQEPTRLASLAGMRALLGPRVGFPVRGSIPDVQRLSREDLVRFHREHYVAGNMAVIAVGDLTMQRLEQLARAGFGALPARAPKPLPPLELAPAPQKTAFWIVDRPGAVQSAVFVGQLLPERSAPGHEARQVMNNLLGGLFTSRLNQNLREQHAYTYGVRSSAVATRRWGAFVAMSSIKTENTADALEQLFAEVGGLATGQQKPLASDELERAKTDLVHQLGANLEHVSRILGDTGELFIDGSAPDYNQKYPSLIGAVDAATVQAEAQRLTPDRSTVVIVGDRAQVAPQLEAKGWAFTVAPPELTE